MQITRHDLFNLEIPEYPRAHAIGNREILPKIEVAFFRSAWRPTAAMAQERNRFVASISPTLFIAYAELERQLARLIASMPLRYLENPSRRR